LSRCRSHRLLSSMAKAVLTPKMDEEERCPKEC
jgi:hypothetical protein